MSKVWFVTGASSGFGREIAESDRVSRHDRVAAERAAIDPSTLPARSPEVVVDNPVFVPPFLGTKVIKGISLDEISSYLNETALFRTQWGYRPDKAAGEKDEDFKIRIRSVLRGGRLGVLWRRLCGRGRGG